ncbi:MAG TPA: hypothetical protein DCP61_03430 [Treponema sp.]|nr:hypothetical protein [Treponema sp.]
MAGENPQAVVEKGWESVTILKGVMPDKLLLNEKGMHKEKSNSLYCFLLLYMHIKRNSGA